MDEQAARKEIDERVLAILGRPAADWESGFEQLCDEYPDHAARIQARVRRMLEIRKELDDTAFGVAPGSVDAIPARIGPFRVLEVLGEGGMGTVYLAEQEQPLRRRVALKVIKLGMDTKRVLARFEIERQALSRMNHHGIARVLEAGSTDHGRPWFAMELVGGDPITTYCDAHSSSVRERLELFVEVCAAVQHAHQKGVIHRDLKPSNILVASEDGRPVAKIIDFGLARAIDRRLTEHSLMTGAGGILGTPEYMSPEQVEGGGHDVDTRTDVYALGVVLYELLVGALPFDAAHLRDVGVLELQRRIREEEPTRPSSRVTSTGSSDVAVRRRTEVSMLAAELHGDLDWIAMKALEKERERRYQSTGELAADVTRYLRDEPVAAMPPSVRYRLTKFVRRNRLQVAAAASVVLALVIGLVASTILFLDARDARAQADQRAEQATRVTEFLVELFDYAEPRRSLGEQLPVGLLLRRGVQKVHDELAGQPTIRARLLASLGRVHRGLGSYATAEALLDEALVAAAESGNEVQSSDQLRWRLALGEVRLGQGRYEEASELFATVLDQVRRERGPDDTLVADCVFGIGVARWRLGALDASERLLADAMDRWRNAGVGDHLGRAICIVTLAGVLHDAGQHERSRQLFEQSLSMLERLFPNGHPEIVGARANLVRPLLALGEHDAAERSIEQARRDVERIFGPEHPDVAFVLIQQAHLLTGLGRDAEAERLLRRAVGIDEKLLGPNHPTLAHGLNDLGMSLSRLRQHTEAVEILDRAQAIYRAAYDGDHLHLAICLGNLAEERSNVGQLDTAQALADESLAMRRRLEPEGGAQVVLGMRQQAWVLMLQNRLAESVAVLRDAVQQCGGLDESPDVRAANSAVSRLLCHVLNRLGDGAGAETAGLRALEIESERDHPDVALLLYNLGWACAQQEQSERAETFFERSIAMYRKVAPDHADLAYPLGHLGSALGRSRPADAAPLLEEALAIRRRVLGSKNFWTLQTLQTLAVVRLELEQFTRAELLFREAWDTVRAAGGADDPATDAVRRQLVDLYERWGKPEEAQKLRSDHRK